MLTDDISQSYRQGLSSSSRCEVPRAANASAHSALEPQNQRRLPAHDLALTATHQLTYLGPMVFRGVEDTNAEKWNTTFSTVFGAFAWRVMPQGISSSPTTLTARQRLDDWYATRGAPPTRESVTTQHVFLDSASTPVQDLSQERIVVSFLPGQFVTLPGCPPPEEVVACLSGRDDYSFISQEWICNCGVLELRVDCPPAPANYLEDARFPDEDALFGKKMHPDGAETLLVTIPGRPAKRVKFCIFDDACHHAEHMIINIEEFPEYTPDQRPESETPENQTPAAGDGNQLCFDAIVAEYRERADRAPCPEEVVDVPRQLQATAPVMYTTHFTAYTTEQQMRYGVASGQVPSGQGNLPDTPTFHGRNRAITDHIPNFADLERILANAVARGPDEHYYDNLVSVARALSARWLTTEEYLLDPLFIDLMATPFVM